MTPLVRAKIALAIIGIILWGYGVRSGESGFSIAGTAVLLVAFLLRFFRRRQPPGSGLE